MNLTGVRSETLNIGAQRGISELKRSEIVRLLKSMAGGGLILRTFKVSWLYIYHQSAGQ